MSSTDKAHYQKLRFDFLMVGVVRETGEDVWWCRVCGVDVAGSTARDEHASWHRARGDYRL
jgi:hypothetical protein